MIYTKVACYVVCKKCCPLPGKAIAPCVTWTWVFSKQPLPWAKCRIASPTILGREVKWLHEHAWTAPTEGMQVPSGACIHCKVQAAQVVKICRFFQLKSFVYPRKVLWCLLRHWRKIQLWSLPARTTLLSVCLCCVVCVCVCVGVFCKWLLLTSNKRPVAQNMPAGTGWSWCTTPFIKLDSKPFKHPSARTLLW